MEAGKRNVEVKLEGMRAQLSEVEVGTSSLQEEIRDLRSKLEATEHENVELRVTHEELL